jgi:hypothetical protein
MLFRMKIAAIAKICALLLALPAAAQLVQPWEAIITPGDRALLDIGTERFIADTTAAAKAGTPYGIKTADVLALLRAPAHPVAERDLVGDWRCRSVQVNMLGIFAYPYFRCRVRETGEGLFFEKLSGSQRVSGVLHKRDAQSFVLLAGATVNNEPQRAYQGDTRAAAEELEHNQAGILTRSGAARLRVVFPADNNAFEVYELLK